MSPRQMVKAAQGEVLPAPIQSRSEAQPLVRQAIKHFREARRATIQVMADLRRLQDGEVHRLYGHTNFASWAEQTFDGLSAGNVKQLVRAGAVALELERRGLIDLDKPEGIGTTALRALSALDKELGTEQMVNIARKAFEIVEDGREVSATTVNAAMALLLPSPEPILELPAALAEPDEDEEEEEEDEDEKLPAKVRELIERIRDLSWELPRAADELAEVTEQLKAELAGADAGKDEKWIASKR